MFSTISEVPLPEGALLQEFADRGEYTDCFVARVEVGVTFPMYVESFYTTPLFKAEPLLLRLLSHPSTDDEARRLARNERHAFAAWNEHARTDNQLVMMDVRGQTCSWFMLSSDVSDCQLYFGSAVMRNRKTAKDRELKRTYRMLMGLHRLYSRALLRSARARISRRSRP